METRSPMEARSFFYALGKLVDQIGGAYDAYGRACKVRSANLLWILYALNDGKGHSQKQISEDWAIPRSTANTIVKELESEGYVCLSQIKGTRRELLISLTPRGKEYAEGILSDLYRREEEIFAELSDPEGFLSALRALAEKMQSVAQGQ